MPHPMSYTIAPLNIWQAGGEWWVFVWMMFTPLLEFLKLSSRYLWAQTLECGHTALCELAPVLTLSIRDPLLFALVCVHTRSVTSGVSDSLQPYGLWPTRLLCPWGFSRQEYFSGLLCPPSGGLPDLGIEPMSLRSLALEGWLLNTSATLEHRSHFETIHLFTYHWNIFSNRL